MDVYDNFPAIFSPNIFPLIKISRLGGLGSGVGKAQEGPIPHLCADRAPPAVNEIVLCHGSDIFGCSWQAGVAREWPGSDLGGGQEGSAQAGHRHILGASSHISPKLT